jgi:surfeit locus 1 family protein
MPEMTKRRPPFWATILTATGMLVLCGLGTWQLQRLEWKEGLLAQLAAARTQPPVTSAVLIGDAPGTDLAYRPAAVYGLYDAAGAFLVGPRTRDGEVGYHLLTPLQIAEDDEPPATLLVNRGWVLAMPAQMPAGFVAVRGLLRLPERANMFVPPNDPLKNEWFSIDLAQLATEKQLQNLLPYILYAEGEEPADPVMSVGAGYHPPGGPDLPNNHRQYAFFWFAMAGVLAVIYVLRFLRPQ